MSQAQKAVIVGITVAVAAFGLLGGYKWIHAQQSAAAAYQAEGAQPSATPSITSTPAQTQSSSSCYSASQAASAVGQTGCVEFTVSSTYTSSKCNAYLDQYSDYTSGFSAWIPDGCGLGSTLLNEYAGKTIDVTGTITSYDGAPEIEISSASQVSLAK